MTMLRDDRPTEPDYSKFEYDDNREFARQHFNRQLSAWKDRDFTRRSLLPTTTQGE